MHFFDQNYLNKTPVELVTSQLSAIRSQRKELFEEIESCKRKMAEVHKLSVQLRALEVRCANFLEANGVHVTIEVYEVTP